MLSTPQTDTQNVLEHGTSVNKYFKDLIGDMKLDWRLPNWFQENKDFILQNLHSYQDIKEYQIMHDIGKSYCMTIDEEGKRHFPNHSEVSYNTYKKISDNKIVADLILKDMIIHTIKSDDINNFIKNNDIKTSLTLLITSLCELHSNASMFGGINSTSFKIKFKQIDRKGKQIINQLLHNCVV